MSLALLIISLLSAVLSSIDFLYGRRTPTQQFINFRAGILLVVAIVSGVLSYWTSIETEEKLQLAHTRVDSTQEQITEIRTPRRMESRKPKRMLVARLKPYTGQKYDMKVFRDQDSLELATTIQTVLKEVGWVNSKVYPKHATQRYAETRDDGVFVISGKVETRRASEARMALHGALNEAGLYDDSSALTPVNCVQTTRANPRRHQNHTNPLFGLANPIHHS